MPHANKSHWQSLYRGRPVTFAPVRSVDELVERARVAGAEIDHLLKDLPEIGMLHEHVEMRATAGCTPTAEIYVPKGPGPFPVFLHIHGGGWFTGSAKAERRFGMRFAEAGILTVNLDYALAPRYPFPKGLEDCIYAARWIFRNIERYGGDPGRLAIGGGSAGANLAAETALALHNGDATLDGGDLAQVAVRFRAAVLLFGVLDVRHWICEPHYYAGDSEIYVQSYLGPNFTGRVRDPRVSPIEHPNLASMPPTYLCCGAEDALLSHSLRFTEALTLRDVPTTLSVVENADHEFLKIPDIVPSAAPELRRIIEWLWRRLA